MENENRGGVDPGDVWIALLGILALVSGMLGLYHAVTTGQAVFALAGAVALHGAIVAAK